MNYKIKEMTYKSSPTIIQQDFIEKPVATVYQSLLQTELTPLLWGMSKPYSIEEGNRIRWIDQMTEITMEVYIKKLIPKQLISTVWQHHDIKTTVDYEFHELTSKITLLTFKAYDFEESGSALLQTIKDKRLVFIIALNALKGYFTSQESG